MSVVILFGIVVMWAVVLIPMWLRRHDESEETRSVDRFSSAMHTLSRREPATEKRYVVMPTRARSHEVHVSGASESGAPRRRRPVAPRPSAAAVAAGRRRRTLIVLLVVTVLTVVGAIVVGGLAMWSPQIVADAALVAFVLHLRNRARLAALVRPSRRPVRPYQASVEPRYVRVDDEDEPYEDEYAPVAVRYASPASAVFDQSVIDEVDLIDEVDEVDEPAVAVGGGYAVFDQDVMADSAPIAAQREAPGREIVFDQDIDEDRPVADRVAAYERDLKIDVPLFDPASEPARVAANSDIGARPWEPVPVPKPVYASKPPAPPRRSRAPFDEPLLPPIEHAAELDPVHDLEEILDRRWAVND